MRRYELMLVLRPDVPDDKSQGVIDRTTRSIAASGGQIVKVSPWGRRRLAYPIDRHREGSYHIVHFDAPATVIAELERSLLITEEVLRHLVTRVERPTRSALRDGSDDAGIEAPDADADEAEGPQGEQIDEADSFEAPAAID